MNWVAFEIYISLLNISFFLVSGENFSLAGWLETQLQVSVFLFLLGLVLSCLSFMPIYLRFMAYFAMLMLLFLYSCSTSFLPSHFLSMIMILYFCRNAYCPFQEVWRDNRFSYNEKSKHWSSPRIWFCHLFWSLSCWHCSERFTRSWWQNCMLKFELPTELNLPKRK